MSNINLFLSNSRQKTFKYACVFLVDKQSISSFKTHTIEDFKERLVSVGEQVTVKWHIGKILLDHKAKVLFLHNDWLEVLKFEKKWIQENAGQLNQTKQKRIDSINHPESPKQSSKTKRTQGKETLAELHDKKILRSNKMRLTTQVTKEVANVICRSASARISIVKQETAAEELEWSDDNVPSLSPLPSLSPVNQVVAALPTQPVKLKQNHQTSPPPTSSPCNKAPSEKRELPVSPSFRKHFSRLQRLQDNDGQCSCKCASKIKEIDQNVKYLLGRIERLERVKTNFSIEPFTRQRVPFVSQISPIKKKEKSASKPGISTIETRLFFDNKSANEADSCPTNIELSNTHWVKAFELKAKASSYKNFAALLMLKLFDHHELSGRNCHGVKKPAIEKKKLDIIKSFCWELYPTEMNSPGGWRACTKAIDEILRRNNRTKQVYTETLLTVKTYE